MNIYAHVTENNGRDWPKGSQIMSIFRANVFKSRKKGIETLLHQGFYPLYFYSHSIVAGGLLVIS